MLIVGLVPTELVTICSVEYKCLSGWALCTAVIASIFPL